MGLPKHFTKQQIQKAQQATRSTRAAARYLNCSYNTYKMYAKQYIDETTGKTLFDKHLNPHGKGISKFLSNKGKEPALEKLLDGTIPRHSYSIDKLKARLLNEVVLRSECYKCGFHERRASDMKQPFLLNFKDKNKNNWNKDNLEILCYNCYYIHIDDVFSVKRTYDTVSKKFKEIYYFWVKNKKTTPQVEGRTLNANDVAELIADPAGYGYPCLALLSKNSLSFVK
jgi:transposase